MGPDKLDKFIKGQVENHKTPTDPDALWKAIQAKQGKEEKPKRRFLFFWLFGAAVIVLAGLGILFYTLNTTDNTTASALLTEESNDLNTSTTTETQTDKTSLTSDDETTNELSIQDDDAVDSNSTNPQNTDSNSNSNSNSNNSYENSLSNYNKTSNITSKPNKSAAQQQSSSKNVTDNPTTVTAKNKNTTFNKQSKNNEQKNSSPAVSDSIQQNNIIAQKEHVDLNNNSEQKNSSDKSATTSINLLQLGSLYISLDAPSSTLSFVEDQERRGPAPDYVHKDRGLSTNEKNWLLSTGLGFTYGRANNRLSSDNDEYLQIRKDSETALDAVRINFDMRLQHKTGFYIKPGFEYEQINDRFDFQSSRDTLLYRPDVVIAEVYDMQGGRTDSIGEAQVVERNTITKEIYNRYRSIDIPLLVGYTRSKNKLGWFVEGGASFNLWFKNTGEIFLDETDSGRMEGNSYLFKNRTGISLLANAGLSYQLTEQFSTWASPGIKYHLGNFSSDKNLIEHKPINYGMQVGIRYHW